MKQHVSPTLTDSFGTRITRNLHGCRKGMGWEWDAWIWSVSTVQNIRLGFHFILLHNPC